MAKLTPLIYNNVNVIIYNINNHYELTNIIDFILSELVIITANKINIC